MPRPRRMLRVESFSVISVIADRGWKIEKADASRDVLPLGKGAERPGVRENHAGCVKILTREKVGEQPRGLGLQKEPEMP